MDNGATITGKTSRVNLSIWISSCRFRLIILFTSTKLEESLFLCLCVRFKKFNDHVLRRILVRDNRAESSIVVLYKKLELQNAIELLDTTMGDISAAPSVVSLKYVQHTDLFFLLLLKHTYGRKNILIIYFLSLH